MSVPVNMSNIGKSGLMVSKQALATTGHNIANVNTEGFSRQVVDQSAGPNLPSGRLTFGNGAWAKKVSRVSDEYLERRIQKEHKEFANIEEKDVYLQQTEQIMNESNTEGMNRLATKFFNEFRKLSADTGSSAVRASVREASHQLIGEVRRMSGALDDVAKNIDTRIEGYVGQMNALSKEVRDLNILIDRAELGGGDAPDLKDQRDIALKKLGAFGDISTNRDADGRVTVTLGGHIPIVCGEEVTPLYVLRTGANEKTGKRANGLDVFVGNPVPERITDKLNAGRFGGLLEVRDKDIAGAVKKLDEVAYAITKEVNGIHRQGFGLDGINGRDFFKDIDQVEGASGKIAVSDTILNNIDSIAAAKEPNSLSDNRIAIALSGIGDLKGIPGVSNESNSSILDVYNGMISELAVKTGATKSALIFQKDLLSQLENTRDAISGVNLDEETANLVKFQHAYQANAKVLQVAEESLQSILQAFR